MIKLGTAAFNLQVAGLSTEELEEYSSKLFDLWEAQVESELAIISDYSLKLEYPFRGRDGSQRTSALLNP